MKTTNCNCWTKNRRSFVHNTFIPIRIIYPFVFCLFFINQLFADTRTWVGGSGVWDISTANWDQGLATWSNAVPDSAQFDAQPVTTDIIMVTQNITADSVSFLENGYVLRASSGLSLTFNSFVADGISIAIHDGLALNAAQALGVSGGTLNFDNSASLNLLESDVLVGGTQNFYSTSSLTANMSNSLTGGVQNFYSTSALKVKASDGVAGGVQNFYSTSTLYADENSAVSGGAITLYENSSILVGAAGALTSNVSVSFDSNSFGGTGGTIFLHGNNTSIGGIHSLNGFAGAIENASATPATLTVDNSTADSQFSGTISDGIGGGKFSLVKDGTRNLVLSRDNSYTGGTTINGGSLLVNNFAGSATGSGDVIVNAKGTLGGTGIIGGNTIVYGTLEPGTPGDNLSFNQDLQLDSSSTTHLEIASAGTYDSISIGGNFMMAGTLEVQFSGYVPVKGDSFAFFQWKGTQNGSFDNFINLTK